jgi:hypothetical protein
MYYSKLPIVMMELVFHDNVFEYIASIFLRSGKRPLLKRSKKSLSLHFKQRLTWKAFKARLNISDVT